MDVAYGTNDESGASRDAALDVLGDVRHGTEEWFNFKTPAGTTTPRIRGQLNEPGHRPRQESIDARPDSIVRIPSWGSNEGFCTATAGQ